MRPPPPSHGPPHEGREGAVGSDGGEDEGGEGSRPTAAIASGAVEAAPADFKDGCQSSSRLGGTTRRTPKSAARAQDARTGKPFALLGHEHLPVFGIAL